MNESVIFNAAVKLPKEQRSGFLDAACAGDPRLRAEVEGLLQEHDTADSFLARPAANPPATDLFRPITEGPGTVIGPYKLLQQIGEGGFGVVYMAEQQRPVRRKVALKIIKPGMDTREVIARFESERQALALMDHPNIARVLDAGATESGRPYFVMELVKGVPITDYCDKNALPTDKRLALFITVCHAVQHAHQKGVIHRDLKPSNVMVTLHDGQPVPKVIDFGVSKATSQQLTEKTLFTAYGQMIGTPAYMSPEQAEMSGLDIDTRSDTYSLGVLLYELLTGTTPFDGKRLREAGYIEMQRIIREEAPPRPSTRVSTLGEALTILSSQRSTDPRKLGQLLRGDLDVIVMKAMEKERSRRYDTPNAFADDIQRFLDHEAIVARPASAAYRLKKYAERNLVTVTAGLAVAAALLLGTVISTSLAVQALRQRNLADRARVLAQSAQEEAERQRDTAQKAKDEESRQRQLAEEREADAKSARRNEAAQLAAANSERDKATALSGELTRERDELNRRKEHQRRMLYGAQMGLIQKAWDSGNASRAQELLNASRPRPGEADLRGLEWHYWQRMLRLEERALKLPIRLPGPTRPAITYGPGESIIIQPHLLSHDGSRLAAIVRVGSGNEAEWQLQVWNTESAEKEPNFSTRLPAVETPASGSTPLTIPLPPYSVEFLDPQRVVVAREKQAPRGTNPADRTSPADRGNPAERELLTYSLDAPQGQTPATFALPAYFAFSRDGSFLAALTSVQGADDSPSQPTIVILDGHTGAEVDRLPCPFSRARVMALSAGAARVVVAEIRAIPLPTGSSLDGLGEIAILDRASQGAVTVPAHVTQSEPGAYQARVQLVTLACQFTSDATRLAIVWRSLLSEATATLLDAATGHEISSSTIVMRSSRREFSSASRPSFAEFSPDGKWLVSTASVDPESYKLTLWDVAADKPGPEFKGITSAPRMVAFSADSARLLVADDSGAAKVWRIPPPAMAPPPNRFPGRGERNSRITLPSPDGRWLVDSGLLSPIGNAEIPPPPYEVHLRDTTGRLPPRTLSFSNPIGEVQFSPDSSLLAAISVNQTGPIETAAELTIWTVATGKQISLPAARFMAYELRFGIRPAAASVRRVANSGPAFSSDSRRLAHRVRAASSGQGGELRLWDLEHQRQVPVSLPHSLALSVPAFSPDSKLLACSSADHSYVLDAATGAILWQGNERVSRPVFSADSTHLAGIFSEIMDPGPTQRTAVVWDASTGEETGRIALPADGLFDSLEVSHDAGRVAVIGPASVAVYDVATQTALYSLDSPAASVEFARDGRRIITSTLASAQSPGSRAPGSRGSRGSRGSSFPAPGEFTRGSAPETKVWDAFTGQELLSISAQSPLFDEMAPGREQRLAPLAPQAEAESLVDWLAAADADGRFLTRSQIIERLKADPSLTGEARAIALRLVADLQRPGAVRQAYDIVRSTGPARDAYEFALETINESVDQSPDDAQCVAYQGIAHYRLGHYEAALASLQRAQTLYSARNPRATPFLAHFCYLAMTHHHLGNQAQARQAFQQADRALSSTFRTTSSSESARARLVDFSTSALGPDSTSNLLPEAAALLGVQSAFDLLAAGSRHRLKYETDQAIVQYDAAIAIDPENPWIYLERGRAWREKSQSDKLIADADAAIRLDPPHLSTFYNMRGIGWDDKRDYDQAIRDYSEAIRIDPRNTTALGNRGNVRKKKGDLDLALEDINAALSLGRSYPSGYYYRAQIWERKGDDAQALADYNQCLRLRPGDVPALIARARLHSRLGNFSQFVEDNTAALRVARGREIPRVHNDLAWFLATCPDEKVRDGKQAVEHAKQACDLTKWKNANYIETLAAAHAETRNFDEALKFQEQALKLASDSQKSDFESRLKLYRDNKPYRETP